MQASQHLHSHDKKQGVVRDVDGLIGGPLIAPPIYPVLTQRQFRGRKGVGESRRAGHDIHCGGAGERSSVRSRCRGRVTERKPQQCHRALAGNLKIMRGTSVAKNAMLNGTEISRSRNLQQQSLSAFGCRGTQDSFNQKSIV